MTAKMALYAQFYAPENNDYTQEQQHIEYIELDDIELIANDIELMGVRTKMIRTEFQHMFTSFTCICCNISWMFSGLNNLRYLLHFLPIPSISEQRFRECCVLPNRCHSLLVTIPLCHSLRPQYASP